MSDLTFPICRVGYNCIEINEQVHFDGKLIILNLYKIVMNSHSDMKFIEFQFKIVFFYSFIDSLIVVNIHSIKLV